MSKIKNVFVSHYHKDDNGLTELIDLFKNKGYNIRNSSIRCSNLKPKNAERQKKKQVGDETIKRWLRRKISWAGTTLVLIGSKTHTRKWVDWEIKTSSRKDKRIIGVLKKGVEKAELPNNLKKYGHGCVEFNADQIIAALEGKEVGWCNDNDTEKKPMHQLARANC